MDGRRTVYLAPLKADSSTRQANSVKTARDGVYNVLRCAVAMRSDPFELAH